MIYPYTTYNIYIYIWLVVSTPLKNISQMRLLFPIYGKMFQTNNHIYIYMYTRILKIMCISVSICTVDEQNPAPVVNYEGNYETHGMFIPSRIYISTVVGFLASTVCIWVNYIKL